MTHRLARQPPGAPQQVRDPTSGGHRVRVAANRVRQMGERHISSPGLEMALGVLDRKARHRLTRASFLSRGFALRQKRQNGGGHRDDRKNKKRHADSAGSAQLGDCTLLTLLRVLTGETLLLRRFGGAAAVPARPHDAGEQIVCELEPLDAAAVLDAHQSTLDQTVNDRSGHAGHPERVLQCNTVAIAGDGQQSFLDERSSAGRQVLDAALVEARQDVLLTTLEQARADFGLAEATPLLVQLMADDTEQRRLHFERGQRHARPACANEAHHLAPRLRHR